ncbi:endonuclease domain-containing protein [Marinilabilia salmonicolor]|uniref:endonuclease domain-containing protein n=1 Tax=Marinilabilia salmonicolor TaxID=989 RepID=UPI00029B066B|nr:endonuclease domain-containing protein [Marinilabilia salmonicolor]
MPIDNQVNMFFNAKPHIFEKAKDLRKNMTPAELKLWKYIKNNQILGLRFRRQHPIDIFIADFYCHQIKLVIELDGEVHNNNENHEYDVNRTAELERLGITVIRFNNHEIMDNIEKVVEQLKKICEDLLR